MGIDSRLEFAKMNPVRYTLLRGKPFPELKSFTIGMWINVYRSYHDGTILSYKHGNRYNMIRLMSGPTLKLKVHDYEVDTKIVLNATTWFQMTWSWTSVGEYTKTIFLNVAVIR